MLRSVNSPPVTSIARRAFVAAVLFFAAAVYLSVASKAEELPPRESLARLPMRIDSWSGRREADFTPEILAVLGVDDYITRSYTSSAGQRVGLYIGYHDSQRQGDTIHSPLNCLPGAGWEPAETGRITIPVTRGPGSDLTQIEANRVIVAKGLDRALVLYWYQSHRRVVASEYWGKVYTVLDAVRYNRTDAAMVRIVVGIPDGADAHAAEQEATRFAQALFPLLPRHLPS